MKNLKSVNIFDLDVYIENNEQITKLFSNELNDKNFSIRGLSRKTGLSHTTISLFLKGKSMKSRNLEKIVEILKIDKTQFGKLSLTIHSDPYKLRKYNMTFPIKLTPLHIRLVSHLLGDSSLEKYGCRWYQQDNSGGKCMVELINLLIGIEVKKTAKDSYGLPIIILDIAGAALNLSRKDLKTPKLIKKALNLPKEFRLQLLAALIVDEGHITKSIIKIANTNLVLLKSLKKLVDSLGYSCSIKSYKLKVGRQIMIKNQKARINYQLYNLLIYADGLLKFKQDLDNMIKNYGDIVSLWHKQKDLIKFSGSVDMQKLEKTRISKNNIIPKIREEIIKKPIKINEFAKKYNLNYIRAYKLFFRLKEKEEIKKISTGVFASVNYEGPTNLTLRSKIEELLNKKPISVGEIANVTNNKSKSIATQLSKLCKVGLVKRIKKGVYSLT